MCLCLMHASFCGYFHGENICGRIIHFIEFIEQKLTKNIKILI